MIRIELDTIINTTQKTLEVFEIQTLADFPGTEIAVIEPLEERQLFQVLVSVPLSGHEGGGRSSILIRNQQHQRRTFNRSCLGATRKWLRFFYRHDCTESHN